MTLTSAGQLTAGGRNQAGGAITFSGKGVDLANSITGAQNISVDVENNWLSVQEADRKAVLARKEKSGAITADEKHEPATISQTDKSRDLAIKAVCTDGNKGGSVCGALIGPA
ncbi:hypothetical protein SAMN05216516_10984 [Izhakiella capsodis]|uniref:DUF6862 domain-containing protein n=1 Tax=Izhakiella capsodis TaxID=1367852 RepID=A0A1I4ZQ15_9GAMM|nr:hypothetical protein [Izhakiella capsodis]SFN52143.1 hypothetical protein SAMN05216516_10984 [Izhakiella capsodis]